MFPDVSEVELCSSGGRQGGDCTDEVASFSHRVDYDHDGVLPIRLQEFSYKIHANSVPRRIQNWEGVNVRATAKLRLINH